MNLNLSDSVKFDVHMESAFLGTSKILIMHKQNVCFLVIKTLTEILKLPVFYISQKTNF